MSGIGASSGGLNAGIGGRPAVLRGRYRIKRLLGRGGMGAVYLATDALFGDQPCAVKELLGDASATPAEAAEAEERFAREARLLATLEHPNLPNVRDYFSEQGQSYLVMDYIDGETVEQRVTREGPQSQQVALDWAQEICAALEYLHAQTPPIIFRDVAPDNIMVESSGHVKLIDFGIARVFNPSKQTDTLRFGKVGYAPPEQFSGRGQTTPRSDLFALGATLHFVLTGRDPSEMPFVFPPIRESNPSVSAEVEQAILSAVQMDPARRPTDARTFAEGLGLTLPPLVLPAPSAALLVEMPPVPARPALPERRLVVFRPAVRLYERQNRQVQKALRIFVGAMVIFFLLFGGILSRLPRGAAGFPFPIVSVLPLYLLLLLFILIIPSSSFVRKRQTRGRVALGRQGMLLLNVQLYGRRQFIAWEDMEAVEPGIHLMGARLEMRLRRGSRVRLGLMHRLNTRMMASKADLLLMPWTYEQMAVEQSPVPAMNLMEVLLWYWQNPQRRAELASLPPRGQECGVDLLREAVGPLEPVRRWVGLPAWASLGLFIGITQALTIFQVQFSQGMFYTGYGVSMMGLVYAGLALLLARANRRGGLFKLGVLALSVGCFMYFFTSIILGEYAYVDANVTANPAPATEVISSGLWFLAPMLLAFALVFTLKERRDDARSYTIGEVLLLIALLLVFAVTPSLQFAWTSIFATTSLASGDAILYFCQLPHLALLAIVLCYFQGRSVRAQRLSTAGVFLCGLGMVFGAPGLYAAMLGWMVAHGWLSVNLAVYGPFWATLFGMNLVAGSLVMVGSARRLRMLSGGQAVLPELRADTCVALASATTVLRRRPAALPSGKAD